MNTGTTTPARQAALTGLAVIGFIALVVLGLWLAVYAARSIPVIGDGIGAAATYIGAMFTPEPEPGLAVVPSASTTIPFGGTASSTPAATSTSASPATGAPVPTTPRPAAPAPIYYRTVQTTYPTPGSTAIEVPRTYSGLPDLIISSISVGYIDSDGDFVADSSIRRNQELAAEILVVNTGTNKTGSWKIKVTVPTEDSRTSSETDTMQSLEPNQPLPITLILSRGDPRVGTNQITVVVDSDKDVAESNENNNTDSASITVAR